MAENSEGTAAGKAVTGGVKEAAGSFYLPEVLVVEILTRLPVKSLVRFSCVDKTWYATIKSPSFVYFHAKHNNSNNFMSWADHYFRVDVGFFSPDPDKYLSKFPHGVYDILLPHNVRKPPVSVELAGYCHGIFCFYWMPMSPTANWTPVFTLCNPATNEFRVLPESRLGLPPYKMLEDVNAGFGYDPKANDYKIIKLVHFEGTRERIDAVEIYSLSTDSWKIIDAFQHNVHIYGIECFGKHTDDGFYHWFVYQYEDDDDNDVGSLVLVSFDMGNDVFRVTQLPEKYTDLRKNPSTKKYAGYSLSPLHHEKLRVVFSFGEPEGATTTFEIYELHGDSWSHVLSVQPVAYNHCTLGFWKTDELLVLRPLPHRKYTSFMFDDDRSDDDEYELIRGGYPFLYNVVTKQYRDLYGSREVNHIYKASLVSIKGGACESSFDYT